MTDNEPRLRPGHPPWETFAGIRVGGVAGALLGALIAVVSDGPALWLIAGVAVIGAVVGYVVAVRGMRT